MNIHLVIITIQLSEHSLQVGTYYFWICKHAKTKLEKLIICPTTGCGAKIPRQDSLIPLPWYPLKSDPSPLYHVSRKGTAGREAPPPLSLGRVGFRAPSTEA